MAGKRQKPAAELVFRRGGRVPDTLVIAAPLDDAGHLVRVDVPLPPDDISEYARDRWQQFWLSPVSAVASMQTHGEAISHWIRLVSRRHDLWLEWERIGPLVRSVRGTPMTNPVWRIVRDLDEEIAHYEEQFGMTPLAQMRLGVEFMLGKGLEADLKSRGSSRPTLIESMP